MVGNETKPETTQPSPVTKNLFLILVSIFGLIFISEVIQVIGIYEASFFNLLRYDVVLVLFLVGLPILGITFLIKTIKDPFQGEVRKLFLFMGWAIVGIPVGIFLHNFFYALAEIATQNNITRAVVLIFDFFEVASFIAALLLLPIFGLIGAIGGLYVLFHKK